MTTESKSMRALVDAVILRCGTMSPETADDVRECVAEVARAAFREGWIRSYAADYEVDGPGLEELWLRSNARRAFLPTPEELEA